MKNSNEHLEKIRAACIAANPSIMELKFGLVVKNYDSDSIILRITDDQIFLITDEGARWTSNSKKLIEDYGILGRPIRLADIFILRETVWPSQICADIVSKWNLRDDDLSHQSPETLEFIASLL